MRKLSVAFLLLMFVASGMGADSTGVKVGVKSVCRTSLNEFDMPGEPKDEGQAFGETIIGKSEVGFFTLRTENTGSLVSNYSIERLEVTSEKKDPWQRGEPFGSVVKDYGTLPTFKRAYVDQSNTTLKEFNATFSVGNYTAGTRLNTNCTKSGLEDSTESKSYLNGDDWEGESTDQDSFKRWNFTSLLTNYITSEGVRTDLNETSSESVSDQRSGTDAFTANITLNSTDFSVYTFNTTSTMFYDRSCASKDQSIDNESGQCAPETGRIKSFDMNVTSLSGNGTEATYALLRENQYTRNTTLECDEINSSSASCDYIYTWERDLSKFGNFQIINRTGAGQGGSTKGEQSTNQTVPAEVNTTGSDKTNQTVPEDVNSTGDQDTNETIAKDVNQTGEESNQTIEGNNPDAPGQTPVPEPEPEPEPEPTPVLSVDMEPLNRTYNTTAGSFVPAQLRIDNAGDEEVSDLSILPQVDKFQTQWNISSAEVASLDPGENVTREILVKPSEETDPGLYVVPVTAEVPDKRLDLDYFTVRVVEPTVAEEQVELPKLGLKESPRSVSIKSSSNQTVPLLIENTGDTPLTNVQARVQNLEDCGSFEVDPVPELGVNETASINIHVSTLGTQEQCNSTVILSSDNGAYAFSKMSIDVEPERDILPEKQNVPFIAIAWTSFLAFYALLTKRLHFSSFMAKAPLILLVVGETLIILFMTVNYYGIVQTSVLPF